MQSVYDKPIIYLLIHVGLGFSAVWHPYIIWLIFLYQGLQLILNKRFFIIEGRIENGNNYKHTIAKLLEFSIGYAIGSIIRFMPRK